MAEGPPAGTPFEMVIEPRHGTRVHPSSHVDEPRLPARGNSRFPCDLLVADDRDATGRRVAASRSTVIDIRQPPTHGATT